MNMEITWWGGPSLLLLIYIGVCGALIAKKTGRSPVLYFLLSIFAPLNLIVLGYLAFTKCKIEVRR